MENNNKSYEIAYLIGLSIAMTGLAIIDKRRKAKAKAREEAFWREVEEKLNKIVPNKKIEL